MLDKIRLRRIIFSDDTRAGRIFDIAVLVAIVLSLVTLFVESMPGLNPTLRWILNILEAVLTVLFTIEYALRLYCAESRRGYAFSGWGIIDLIAVLPPYLTFFFPSARYMLMLRAARFLRIFRILRMFVFINEGHLLLRAVGKSLHKIAVYFLFVLVLTSILGTLMFIIESNQPGSAFTDIGTSIYWAITTLSTVGYGDITPVTFFGRLLSGFIMLLGYTIIAIPTGIISVSIIDETKDPVKDGRCPRCDSKVRKGDRYCSNCGEKL
jgi:voltage-gated potassium channel